MKRLFIFIFTCISVTAYAQPENDPFGESYNFDSTDYSDYSDTFDDSYGDFDYGYDDNSGGGQDVPQKPIYKKYERFVAPMDTITDLMTYTGVVPFTPMENDVYDGGTIDSLYLRAKLYLLKRYVENFKYKNSKDLVVPKDLLVEDYRPDGENGRIIIRPTVPLFIKNNSFSTTPAGTLTFKIEIRVKEEKYKYTFTSFVHNTVERGSEKPIKTYAEFYVNNKRDVKGTDQILLAIDRMVKGIIKDLDNVMKDPIVRDLDDF
ncbi:MAG: DUF4468 domain-containing protein [Bacteroidia bacterium]